MNCSGREPFTYSTEHLTAENAEKTINRQSPNVRLFLGVLCVLRG
jgi:hypothetical protein